MSFFTVRFVATLLHRSCLGVILMGAGMSACAEVSVLASIKPLALIAQEVVGSRGKVDILLPANSSPHDYALRVSDVRRLQAADIVLWVGPELESFLPRSLSNVAPDKILSAYELADIDWPVERHNEPEGALQESSQEDHHNRDPHLWLNPRNAAVIAQALAARLAFIDPPSAAVYQQNAERFAAAAIALDDKLARMLKPLSTVGFVVYHEGYLHFVEHYGLRQLAYVTFTPERRPGAKHLYQLRQTLKEEARCLFIEPYYDMDIATDLAEELQLRLAKLDPIGVDSVTSYAQLLNNMAEAFRGCLKSR